MTENNIPITDTDIQECTRYLQDLIQINTTNPPGNEIEACRYLAKILKKEGISYKIIEPLPGRGNLVAWIDGDGSHEPLLLSSHLDVVPCEKSCWTKDPFAGVIEDGQIWGRGAVDMKNMTAMELAIFLKIKREKIPLKRKVILAAVADEETGCDYGSKWLVNSYQELIQAEYAINEVGGFNLTVDNQTFYPIGVAEKGHCRLRIIAQGEAGHGSLPSGDQAIAKIGLAAHRLATESFPFHNPDISDKFVESLAKEQGIAKKLILKGIKKEGTSEFILTKLFSDQARARNFYNMFHNLATPTIIRGGKTENVIPSQAELFIDGRIVPGQNIDTFIAELKNIIGKGYQIEIIKADNPVTTNYDNEFYKTLAQTIEKADPGAKAIPFLIPGYTDAQAYSRIGIKCYGFAPTKLTAHLNFGSLFHGHDERLPVSSLGFGLKVLWDVIERTCV